MTRVHDLDALRREANLATRLEHPNVTQIQDFQIEDGAAYLVMEYVPNVLSKHIRVNSVMLRPPRLVEIRFRKA